MRIFRQFLPGILIPLISILIILGSFILSYLESTKQLDISQDTTTPSVTPQATVTISTIELETPTLPLPTITFRISSTPTACPRLPGWIEYLVKSGDSLDGLAQRYQTSSDILLVQNCLLAENFLPGITLLVPALPTNTATRCGPIYDWIMYPVQSGDTLYSLSIRFQITVQELQSANCMGSSTLLVAGAWIFVPPRITINTPPDPTSFTPTNTSTTIIPDFITQTSEFPLSP